MKTLVCFGLFLIYYLEDLPKLYSGAFERKILNLFTRVCPMPPILYCSACNIFHLIKNLFYSKIKLENNNRMTKKNYSSPKTSRMPSVT